MASIGFAPEPNETYQLVVVTDERRCATAIRSAKGARVPVVDPRACENP